MGLDISRYKPFHKNHAVIFIQRAAVRLRRRGAHRDFGGAGNGETKPR
jgi:hypothetical protein